MFRRASLTAVALAVVVALTPAVAHAAPAGDDFDSATEITTLPFSTTIDTTGSTKAADDPNPCYFWGEGSVWQRYTAPSDGLLRVTARKGSWGTMLAVYTGPRGALGLEPNACVQDGNYTVHAKAGTTYYFMLIEYNEQYGGPLSFTLRQATRSPTTPWPRRPRRRCRATISPTSPSPPPSRARRRRAATPRRPDRSGTATPRPAPSSSRSTAT
ncbi:hypothetical protein [Lentzea atacamensis]|uniref:hypothetical protein n=1 Tax=Lentzea atacamensis TaxID=531938 RepID=UPI0011B5A53A|nr:hypothetical protein [Lentzea atacamensis]